MRKLLIAVLLAALSTAAFGQENHSGTTYFLVKKDSLTFLKKPDKPSFFTRLLNSLRKTDNDTYQKADYVMQQVFYSPAFRQEVLTESVKKEAAAYAIQYGLAYKPLTFRFP